MFLDFFEKDSVLDLYCRGFDRSEILERTGFDIGWKACNVRQSVKNVDRMAYRMAFALHVVTKDKFLDLLRSYFGGKIVVTDIFEACGLPKKARIRFDDLCDCFGITAFDRSTLKESVVKGFSGLFVKDSPEDLFCRGFTGHEVFEMTGIQAVPDSREYRALLRTVDKSVYSAEFVFQNVSRDAFLGLLVEYADGKMSSIDILQACGLSKKPKVSFEAVCVRMGVVDEVEIARNSAKKYWREKCEATMLSRTGYRCALSCPEIRMKGEETMLRLYGHRHPMEVPLLREKAMARFVQSDGSRKMPQDEIDRRVANIVSKYGVRSTLLLPEVKAKRKISMETLYGAEYSWSCQSLMLKRDETMLLRYGTTVPLRNDVLKAKCVQTNLDRRSVPWPMMSRDCVLKSKATQLALYGETNYAKTRECIERRRMTNLAVRGVDNPMRDPGVRERHDATMLARTGYAHALQSPDTFRVMVEGMRERGSLRFTGAEDSLYQKLVAVFGDADVFRQYGSSVYPYPCDFYVQSRDMYIELNGFATHNNHWFGSCSTDEACVLAAQRVGTSVCQYGDRTWTVKDVEKRACATRASLNYIVFWAADGRDADLWFALGCPDGRDWEREYSWVPMKELKCEQELPAMLSVDDVVLRDIVRVAHWSEFYARELEYWRETFDLKWGTRQVRQYSRILRNFPDLPFDMITSQAILDSLNHSGVVSGYSEFHVSGLTAFLKKYRPVFLYDPCAGWGEPLVACAGLGVKCFGYSADDSVAGGYARIKAAYGLQKFDFSCSSEEFGVFDFSGGDHDAVFAWLPNEVVSGMPEDVLVKWWRQVVSKSVGRNTRVFGYQASDKIRGVLGEVLSAMGWNKDPHIPVCIQGVARPVEYVEVFVKP